MAQPLRLVGLRNAPDVLLEGVQAQARARGHKGLLGHAEAGIEFPRQLPSQRTEDGNQVLHFAARGHRRAHAQMRHVHQLGLGYNARAVGEIAAHHNLIGIQRLGQLERGGARRMKTLRQTKMVESVEPISAAHGRKAGSSKPAGENLRRGLANPLQARLAAAVVKREDQQDSALARCCCPSRSRAVPRRLSVCACRSINQEEKGDCEAKCRNAGYPRDPTKT